MQNFAFPYFSRDIAEFWRKWHISLSTWFKDYVYIPLGGNRRGVSRMYVNLAIVFLVSGLWHGANWTFIFWGAMHGIYIVFSNLTIGWRDAMYARLKVPRKVVVAIRMFIVFQLVNFSWIYFRADSLATANRIVAKIFSLHWGKLYISALDQFAYGVMAIMILLLVDGLQEKYNIVSKLMIRPVYLRWAGYISLVLIILLIGVFNGSQFIYFQF